MKQCTKCKKLKNKSDFHARPHSRNGINSQCKNCCSERSRIWKQNNRERANARERARYSANIDAERARNREKIKSDAAKLSRRDYNLRRKYGINLAQYNVMTQAGCQICGTVEPGTHNFHVDHDHISGCVRGILCGQCNKGIGHFKDNILLLQHAIQYLKQYQEEEL